MFESRSVIAAAVLMAYAIMGGLAVATLLTLVFLPALYVTWFRIKKPDPQPFAQGAAPGRADVPEANPLGASCI